MQAFDANIDFNIEADSQDSKAKESLSKEGNSKQASSITNRVDINRSKKMSVNDLTINWQKDSKGNFVTKNRWGKLLTRDDRGRMVDYESHTENKRMGARDQISFTSILFCNPMMLLGLGATFALMDNFHQSNKAKEMDKLKNKLEGKKAGKQQKGYEHKDIAKALLLGTDKKLSNIDANNVLSFEDEMKKRSKRRLEEQAKRRQSVIEPFVEKRSITRKNLAKMKAKLESQLEKMRGVASLEDVAKIESQIEKLDRSLKRFSALSMS